jgi:serine/threonine protein kinase
MCLFFRRRATPPSYQKQEVMDPICTAAAPMRGGFGQVSRREDVVYKYVPLERMTRECVQHEVDMMRRLGDHPNIIRVKELCEGPGGSTIVMDYGGVDLFTSPPPAEMQASAFVQMAHGLLHMHLRRVAHRDLKLENIVMDGQGRVRLIDFGLAIEVPAERIGQRICTVPCGSRAYAAPEVWRGPYDPFAADMWSLGVVLYALAFQYFPFASAMESDGNFVHWRSLHATCAPLESFARMYPSKVDLAGVTSDARGILDGCLRLSPSERASFLCAP